MSDKQKKDEVERVKRLWDKLNADLQQDAELAKQFQPLTKAILLGTERKGLNSIKLIDGSQHQVTIRALGEGEIAEAQDVAGLAIPAVGTTPQQVKFQLALASKAIISETFTSEELGKKLHPGTSAKLATAILFLSGYLQPPSMEFFREKSITSH